MIFFSRHWAYGHHFKRKGGKIREGVLVRCGQVADRDVHRGATGLLSITVYPYKLTQRELEARLEPGLSVLPGQYLRFEAPEPVFAQVREVQALPSTEPGLSGGYRLTIALLYGTPSLQPQQATLMTATQWGQAIQRLQEPIAEPLQLSPEFSAEFSRLGPLTVIGGDDFVQKFEALQRVMTAVQPHRRLVILDPLGLFAEEDDLLYWHAGRDVRLSVQAVGSKHFLDAFGELFAPGLRESALRVVADHLPPMQEFMGFQALLDWYSALNVSLKNLILQNYQQVAHAQVFADTQAQALDWTRAAHGPVTVLNLSGLSEPWRGLFYREALQALFQQAGETVVPVLIYPEHYLPELAHWVEKADESELKLLMLASPYVSDAVLQIANNRFWTEAPGALSLQGALTLGLPLAGLPLKPTDAGLSAAASHRPIVQGQPPSELELSDFKPEQALPLPASLPVLDQAPQPPQSTSMLAQGEPLFSSFSIPLYETDGEQLEQNESFAMPDEPLPALSQPVPEPPASVTRPLQEDEQDGAADAGTALAETSHFSSATHAFIASETPEESFTVDLPVLAGVVDLAAPSPQPAPEFLSAVQLSALLNASSVKPLESLDEAPAAGAMPSPAESVPKESAVPLAVSAEAAIAETKPDSMTPKLLPSLAQEPAPLAESALAPASSLETEPALSPASAVAPEAPTEAEEFDFPLAGLDDWERTQTAATSQAHAATVSDTPSEASVSSPLPELPVMPVVIPQVVLTTPALEATSSLPSFPTPDEFEKDEFHFELDPVRAMPASSLGFQPAETDSALAGNPLGQSTVAQSLAAFASLDLPEPDFPDPPSLALTQPVMSAVPPTVSAAASIPAPDQDLQEALDLIFPYKFEAQPSPEMPATVVNAPPPITEEPMAIIPKAVEPVPVDSSGFHAGDRVTHPTYGAGVVQKVIPMEGSVVLNILFDGVGKRLLDPALSELSRAELVH